MEKEKLGELSNLISVEEYNSMTQDEGLMHEVQNLIDEGMDAQSIAYFVKDWLNSPKYDTSIDF